MALCPTVVYLLVSTAAAEIEKNPVTDTRIQWGVFVVVFIPISLGLLLFGWFAWKGDYDRLPHRSSELPED